jgi:hypothetical protein
MKKLIGATAVCALAIGLVVAPSALGVKAPKLVGGSVSVNVTPNPLIDTTTTVTADGGVVSNSNCKKDRTLHFSWVVDGVQSAEVGSTTTKGNGTYTVTLPRPTQTSDTATVDTAVLHVTVDQVTRKVGSKKKGKKTKKGRRFDCLTFSGDSSPVTLVAPSV